MAHASEAPARLSSTDERILRLLDEEGIQVPVDIERRLSLSGRATTERCRRLTERGLVANSNWCCYEITERGARRLRESR